MNPPDSGLAADRQAPNSDITAMLQRKPSSMTWKIASDYQFVTVLAMLAIAARLATPQLFTGPHREASLIVLCIAAYCAFRAHGLRLFAEMGKGNPMPLLLTAAIVVALFGPSVLTGMVAAFRSAIDSAHMAGEHLGHALRRLVNNI